MGSREEAFYCCKFIFPWVGRQVVNVSVGSRGLAVDGSENLLIKFGNEDVKKWDAVVTWKFNCQLDSWVE